MSRFSDQRTSPSSVLQLLQSGESLHRTHKTVFCLVKALNFVKKSTALVVWASNSTMPESNARFHYWLTSCSTTPTSAAIPTQILSSCWSRGLTMAAESTRPSTLTETTAMTMTATTMTPESLLGTMKVRITRMMTLEETVLRGRLR